MRPALLLLLLALCADSQDRAVFQTGVSLVHVDAQVNSGEGRIVDGLTKDDFRILDNRQEQKILHFSAGEEALDLILLVDISVSMRPVVQMVAQAARDGLRELRQGDRIAVMVFNTKSRVLAGFTEDLDAAERTIMDLSLNVRFRGGTMIQTAVDDAALLFQREPRSGRRRAVLIITDNFGLRTRRESTVVRNYWEADALLSGLIISSVGQKARLAIMTVMGPHYLVMQAGMKGIAERTGGDTITSGDPGAAFRESMRRIRARYSLYYATPPAKSGETLSIRVELTADAAKRYPKSRVRARTGYVVK
jgi:VWFA-related protein